MGVTNLATDDYNRKITKLLGLFHTPDKNAQRFQVGVPPEALQLIKRFEDDIRWDILPKMPEAARPCLLKAHGQAVRFAWDIHAWSHDDPHLHLITEAEMQLGIDLVRASFQHIRYAYDPCGLTAFSTAQKILQSLKNIVDSWEQDKILDDGIDSTTIQQRIGVKSKEVNNALQLLDEHNYLAVYDDATNNLKIALHPDFFAYA